MRRAVAIEFTGSSPLTRGKRGYWRRRGCGLRLIPAHAGKTTKRSRRTSAFRAHPRSRGENTSTSKAWTRVNGSSPLTRGKPSSTKTRKTTMRLIPAHAGKTPKMATHPPLHTAHPRSRGENAAALQPGGCEWGSSPLTRGKRMVTRPRLPAYRLIPAHAGKTRAGWRRRAADPAHPRSRGENLGVPAPRINAAGSSPLTRGKLCGSELKFIPKRLIPAHAGKTHRGRPMREALRAHPRSRGENRPFFGLFPFRTGSSPLTRGKLLVHLGQLTRPRLIPAHAGKTIKSVSKLRTARAHPRSRGENRVRAASNTRCAGSSPLTRGKPQSALSDIARARLIPAHAGKTGCGSTGGTR